MYRYHARTTDLFTKPRRDQVQDHWHPTGGEADEEPHRIVASCGRSLTCLQCLRSQKLSVEYVSPDRLCVTQTKQKKNNSKEGARRSRCFEIVIFVDFYDLLAHEKSTPEDCFFFDYFNIKLRHFSARLVHPPSDAEFEWIFGCIFEHAVASAILLSREASRRGTDREYRKHTPFVSSLRFGWLLIALRSERIGTVCCLPMSFWGLLHAGSSSVTYGVLFLVWDRTEHHRKHDTGSTERDPSLEWWRNVLPFYRWIERMCFRSRKEPVDFDVDHWFHEKAKRWDLIIERKLLESTMWNWFDMVGQIFDSELFERVNLAQSMAHGLNPARGLVLSRDEFGQNILNAFLTQFTG